MGVAVGVGRGLRVGRGDGEKPGVGTMDGVGWGVSTGEAAGDGDGDGAAVADGLGEGVGVADVLGTGRIAATKRPSFFSTGMTAGSVLPREKIRPPTPAASNTRPLSNNTNLREADILPVLEMSFYGELTIYNDVTKGNFCGKCKARRIVWWRRA